MLKDIIHLFASENQKNHTKQSTDMEVKGISMSNKVTKFQF